MFPRVAYHLFAEKRKHEGWRVTIKYFQNVVNTIRDLLSPSGEEKSDKTGLHKDRAGFMDVTWASKVVVNTWEDLRTTIQWPQFGPQFGHRRWLISGDGQNSHKLP